VPAPVPPPGWGTALGSGGHTWFGVPVQPGKALVGQHGALAAHPNSVSPVKPVSTIGLPQIRPSVTMKRSGIPLALYLRVYCSPGTTSISNACKFLCFYAGRTAGNQEGDCSASRVSYQGQVLSIPSQRPEY